MAKSFRKYYIIIEFHQLVSKTPVTVDLNTNTTNTRISISYKVVPFKPEPLYYRSCLNNENKLAIRFEM